MKPILLIDFGSTYTKLTAVDVDAETLLGTASAFTTIETDIGDGLQEGLAKLTQETGPLDFAETYACSSAAGGLRMITSGLVPELTSEAARLASLGAGAKVIQVYSFELTEDDLAQIASLNPDIFLLVGGTDGGNTDCILHNAQMLARLQPTFPIIMAGNRSAVTRVRQILAGCNLHVCANVMPAFGKLNIEETQAKIRALFLDRIVQAKGLTQAASLLSDICMPTPSAVLSAVELLAEGYQPPLELTLSPEPGIGELLAVDVGGATTDVYSIATGRPTTAGTVMKGLPEPYRKRTVEGDIGMRYSIHGIVEAAGLGTIAQQAGLSPARTQQLVDFLAVHTDLVPDSPAAAALGQDLAALDFALAGQAVRIATARHAGTLEETYTTAGQTFVQTGKDLREVSRILVTGGSLIHTARTEEIARCALFDPSDPMSLRPRDAEIYIDRSYILAAMGLLSAHYPAAALRIMKKELTHHGHRQ